MNEIRETILSSNNPTSTIDTQRLHAATQPTAPVCTQDVYTGPITRSHSTPAAPINVPVPGAPAALPAILPLRATKHTTTEPRKLMLDRPLVAFDLETTGLNRERDAIVEWGAVKEWPNGQRDEHLFRIKPRVPVQPAAERIHGISNAMLAHCETLDQVAPKIAAIITDCDLLGHNARAFDLPFLTIEMNRVGYADALAGARVVDTLKTFRKAVPRGQGTDNHRLGTAYKYYLNKPLEGAHGALADARASLDVLHAQIERHPGLPNTVEGLEAVEDKR